MTVVASLKQQQQTYPMPKEPLHSTEKKTQLNTHLPFTITLSMLNQCRQENAQPDDHCGMLPSQIIMVKITYSHNSTFMLNLLQQTIRLFVCKFVENILRFSMNLHPIVIQSLKMLECQLLMYSVMSHIHAVTPSITMK